MKTLGELEETTAQLLANFGGPAPNALLPGVLLGTGVADGYHAYDSPIGPVFVAYNPHGVSAVAFREDSTAFESHFTERFGRSIFPTREPGRVLDSRIRRALNADTTSHLPIDLRGLSDFAVAVLRKTLEIPSGEVRPYSWVAAEIGRPHAHRAVGTALASNPIPLLIPCHRIVRSDGHIGDYLFGTEQKRKLLTHENVNVDELETNAISGRRYLGSATTHIFCHPTCRNARRITPTHQRWFTATNKAVDAGYRPCKVCRPHAA
ncbi:MAG: methylated-DNA--[protein]-cysteine S-methyltransferase [Ilumatobacteraceae bacterium]